MDFTFTPNYVTKDNLAIMDIISHNNWKRPIYFTVTAGNENMLGLDKYFYNEGFALRLMPFAPDTTTQALESSNTMIMYNNMMTKFKFGNFKTAKNLDHESLTLFYPLVTRMYTNLADNLIKEGKLDLAKKALKKYVDNMPETVMTADLAIKKYYLAESAFHANDVAIGTGMINNVNDYITDQLNYNYALFQKSADQVNPRDVQLGMWLLNNMVTLTKDYNQTQLNNKLSAQLKDYGSKFAGLPMPNQ
jgi:tetratricopeptide (TPR) repeat protein